MRMIDEFSKFLAAVVGLKNEGKLEESLNKIDDAGLFVASVDQSLQPNRRHNKMTGIVNRHHRS